MLSLALVLSGCSEHGLTADTGEDEPAAVVEDEPAGPAEGTGSLSGSVTTPSGNAPVVAAHVYVVVDDEIVAEAQTDGEGAFLLEGVPFGTHSRYAQSASSAGAPLQASSGG